VLPSVGDKTSQILLSRGVVLSQSTFHLVIIRAATPSVMRERSVFDLPKATAPVS